MSEKDDPQKDTRTACGRCEKLTNNGYAAPKTGFAGTDRKFLCNTCHKVWLVNNPDVIGTPVGGAEEDRFNLLRDVYADACEQASGGKGRERHDPNAERFENQQIVRVNEWLGSNHGDLFQAVKKLIESARLPPDRARAEILGAINYAAAAVIIIDRKNGRKGSS